MHRFFIAQFEKAETVVLPEQIGWQIRKVLRLQKGNSIVIFDGENNEYEYVLREVTPSQVIASFQKESKNTTEPEISIMLYQALLPKDTFEQVLQKATEIGVSSFVPIETKRTILKTKDISQQKRERWEKIVQEASEQSERGKVPQVGSPISFEDAIGKALEDGQVYIAWEEENENFASKVFTETIEKTHAFISLFVGPEGGFSPEEIDFAKAKGVQTVSLGPRILRSETAGIILPALVLFTLGELDRR